MIQHGIFCISLDFELHWGRFDKMSLNQAGKQIFLNTRLAIPKMLKLFEKHQLSVTWATVGMLFNKNAVEWRQHQPEVYPEYYNPDLSAYNWVYQHKLLEPEDPFHFAPELIDQIVATPGMELGTHTYSHYYCLEPGQTCENFAEDLHIAKELAALKGIPLKSLVFPRNQFNESYLKVCNELGIETVRSNPSTWFWNVQSKTSLLKKIIRTADAYLPLGYQHLIPVNDLDPTQKPFCIPASRFYRPWSTYNFANQFKLKRILREMTYAAKHHRLYHLWWHPHNLGKHPDACLQELETIFLHFQELKQKFGFSSQHMEGTRQLLLASK